MKSCFPSNALQVYLVQNKCGLLRSSVQTLHFPHGFNLHLLFDIFIPSSLMEQRAIATFCGSCGIFRRAWLKKDTLQCQFPQTCSKGMTHHEEPLRPDHYHTCAVFGQVVILSLPDDMLFLFGKGNNLGGFDMETWMRAENAPFASKDTPRKRDIVFKKNKSCCDL